MLLLGGPAFGWAPPDPAALKREAQASMAAATAAAQSGDVDKAVAELQHARELARAAADPGDEGVAELYAGVLEASRHTPAGNEAAIEQFRVALPLLAASRNREGQATAAQGMGDSLEALGRAAEARDAYKLALPFLTATAQAAQRARTLIGLSMAERALSDGAGARAHAEAALPLLKSTDASARVVALMQLGMACDDQSDWACGANAFLTAAEVAKASQNPAMERSGLTRGALDAMRQMRSSAQAGETSKAAEQAARAASAFHALGDAASEVTALLASGQYQAQAGEWAHADEARAAALAAAKDDASRARALLALASAANQKGSYRRALDNAEAALPLFAAPDLAPQRALVLLIAGNGAAGVHDTARALGYLAEAQALGATNPSVRAAALAAEAEIRTEQGDPARGADLAREAMGLHEQLGDVSAANKDRGDLGLALAAGGHRAEALSMYGVSLANALTAGDLQQQAATLTNIGTVRLAFGDFAQAITFFRRGQEAARRSNDRDVEATATVQLGMAEHARGDEIAALAAIRQGVATRRLSGDGRGEAIDMCDLALVESETGHVQEALDIYVQARARFASTSDDYNEASALNGIGTVYRRLGALEEARRYYNQAKAIDERDNDEESLSVALNNLGVVAQSLDEPDDALKNYQQALAIQRSLGGRVEQITLLNGIAMLHDAQGDREASIDGLGQALRLAEQIGAVEGQALALHNRGTVRERAGDRRGALVDLRRALPMWRRVGAVQNEAITSGVIARIQAAEGRPEDALARVQTAIGLYESQRGQISSEDLRASWLAGARDAYELRTELLMELDERNPGKGYSKRALEATEAGRARSLLDLLREAHANVLHPADAELANNLRGIRAALNTKALQAMKVDPDGPDGISLAHEIDDLLAKEDRTEATIRAGDPAYASLTAPAPMTAEAIQALLDPQTVLLDFAFGKKRGFVWLVTPDAVRVFKLPPREAVQQAATAMEAAMTASPDPQASARLGAILLDRVAAAIEGKRLVVVADALPQGKVPFAALTVPASSAERGQPLVQSHEVVMEPSVAALAAIRQYTANRAHPTGAIAVFADPVVSVDDPRLPIRGLSDVPASSAGLDLPRLPATRTEAEAILALPRPGSALVRFGFDANRETALDPTLAGYKILHFAVHGATDMGRPELSGLVLSMRAPNGAPRDGFLRLTDIYGLSLPADLVVLSACGSGLGRSVGGEGVVGLSRGFLYAGAASVVATLWDIEDDSTAAMMTHFYAAMWGPRHMHPSAALREAQREMIADGRWNAPRYWAGFTIQGEWR